MPRSLPSNSLDEESTFLREERKLIDEVVVICKRREVFLRELPEVQTLMPVLDAQALLGSPNAGAAPPSALQLFGGRFR